MSLYSLQRRVSHAEVDFLGEFKVAALLGLFEQAAVEASTAAGYDAGRYTREARVWIIRRTQFERFLPIGGTDLVEVETAVQDFRRARSLRRYDVRLRGTLAAQANTDWVYCDLSNGRPARVPPELQNAFAPESATPMQRPPSLPDPPDQPPACARFLMRPSHLDHVVHVNNGIYANFIEDAASEVFAEQGWPLMRQLEQAGALRIQSLDIEYFSDARLGDSLECRTWLLSPLGGEQVPRTASLRQCFYRNDEEILRAASHWVWRRRAEVLGAPPLLAAD